MSRFDKSTLNPLIRDASRRITAALGQDDITARADALVSAREENTEAVAKISKRQKWKMLGLAALAVVGIAGAAAGGIVATSVIAAVAGTTGFAYPLMAAGVSLFGGAAAFLGITVGENNTLNAIAKGLDQKINSEVSNLVTAYPAETAKSSRLSAFLKRTFNPAASNVALTDIPQAQTIATQMRVNTAPGTP